MNTDRAKIHEKMPVAFRKLEKRIFDPLSTCEELRSWQEDGMRRSLKGWKQADLRKLCQEIYENSQGLLFLTDMVQQHLRNRVQSVTRSIQDPQARDDLYAAGLNLLEQISRDPHDVNSEGIAIRILADCFERIHLRLIDVLHVVDKERSVDISCLKEDFQVVAADVLQGRMSRRKQALRTVDINDKIG